MKFKIDENLPDDLKTLLTQHGHDVHTVHDEQLGGSPDTSIYSACQREGRVLITLDLDFSDIRAYPPSESQGVIVLRPVQQDKLSILAVIPDVLKLLAAEPIQKRLWIVESLRVRIRE